MFPFSNYSIGILRDSCWSQYQKRNFSSEILKLRFDSLKPIFTAFRLLEQNVAVFQFYLTVFLASSIPILLSIYIFFYPIFINSLHKIFRDQRIINEKKTDWQLSFCVKLQTQIVAGNRLPNWTIRLSMQSFICQISSKSLNSYYLGI